MGVIKQLRMGLVKSIHQSTVRLRYMCLNALLERWVPVTHILELNPIACSEYCTGRHLYLPI